MCGIVGIVNLNRDLNIEKYKNVLRDMSDKINKRGPDEDGFFYSTNATFNTGSLYVYR